MIYEYIPLPPMARCSPGTALWIGDVHTELQWPDASKQGINEDKLDNKNALGIR